MVGIKSPSLQAKTKSTNDPILKGPEGVYQISETAEEKLRRLRRKVRLLRLGCGFKRVIASYT